MTALPQTPARPAAADTATRVRIVGTRPMPADEAINSMAYAAANGLQGDGTIQAAMWHDVLCEVLDALDTARDDTVQLAHADKRIADLTRECNGLRIDCRAQRERAETAEAERDAARATVREWIAANGPGGWIDDLRNCAATAPAPVPAADVADVPAFLRARVNGGAR